MLVSAVANSNQRIGGNLKSKRVNHKLRFWEREWNPCRLKKVSRFLSLVERGCLTSRSIYVLFINMISVFVKMNYFIIYYWCGKST